MKQETKETILNIVEIIEDKRFPAKQNIADYIILLLHSLDIDYSLVLEISKFFDEEFEKIQENADTANITPISTISFADKVGSKKYASNNTAGIVIA